MSDNLTTGKWYKLKTLDFCGNAEPTEEWIDAKWDGKNLIDAEGITWNEWMHDPSDVVDVDSMIGGCSQ